MVFTPMVGFSFSSVEIANPTPQVQRGGMSEEMRRARINVNLLKKEGTAWDVAYGRSLSPVPGVEIHLSVRSYPLPS